jgi:hypothetical protein
MLDNIIERLEQLSKDVTDLAHDLALEVAQGSYSKDVAKELYNSCTRFVNSSENIDSDIVALKHLKEHGVFPEEEEPQTIKNLFTHLN